ncbi:caspase family protein [Actinomadura formosensis]|uniref:caspase family protein n=1 Tax=Actinomadura formosensis TaxID=60706 RepID=UPI003D8AB9FF
MVGRERGDLARPVLPDGSLKDLNDALRELLRRAGRPSTRDLEGDIRKQRLLETPPSHTRIYDVFVRSRLPDCDLVAALVQVLAQRAARLGSELVPEVAGERFYKLWLAADQDCRETYEALEVRPHPRPVSRSAFTGQAAAEPSDRGAEPVTPTSTTSFPAPHTVAGGTEERASRWSLPVRSESRAYIAGVSRYKHLPDLPGVANGVRDLMTLLTDKETGSFAHDTSVGLMNPMSSVEALEGLDDAAANATDTLFVYFSCHGQVSRSGDLMLALPDTRPDRAYTALPYNWIREIVADAPARRVIVVLDCCFSGRALGTMSGTDEIMSAAVIKGACVIASTSSTSMAMAPSGSRYTAFTGELIRLLAEGVPRGPKVLDLNTIFNELRERITAAGRPRPSMRARDQVGDLGLVANRAHQLS